MLLQLLFLTVDLKRVMGAGHEGNSIKEMKKKNPNLFKESWVRKQARLAQEEQERLDKSN